MKRILSLVLAMLLMLGLSSAVAEEVEPVTLTMFSVQAPIQGPWEDMLFFQEMEKITGVSWEFDLVDSSTLPERKALLLGSGDLPDVLMGANLSEAELLQYGSMGAFLPLEDYINEETMPNLTAFLEANPEYRTMMTSSDGHIYSLIWVSACPRDYVLSKSWVNKEWLEALDLEVPTTVDEYYDMLVAFKNGDPNGNGENDEIALSFATDGNVMIGTFRTFMLAAYGVVTSNGGNGDMYLDGEGNVQYVFTSDAYKAYLEFAHKLYAEGLLDNECFSQAGNQLVAKGNQSLIGNFFCLASYLVDTTENYPKYDSIAPLTSEMNDTPMAPEQWLGATGVYAVSSTCKDPEAALRWADYLYSSEGGILLSQGPEGYGWDYIDDTRTYWDKNVPEGYASSEEYRGTITPNCGTGTPGYVDPDFLLHLNAAHVIDLEEHTAKSYTPYLTQGYPKVKLSEEDTETANTYYTDISKYVESCEARFISGDMGLDQWDAYVENLQSMNLDAYMQIFVDAYADYQAMAG